MVNSSEILDVVELIYFGPALVASAFVCAKHGFSRDAGWLLLVILSLTRLIGASTGIAAENNPTNSSLISCSLITSSIGSTLLVAALTGVVNRVDSGTGQSPIPAPLRKLIQLPGLAAVALGVFGGTKVGSSNASVRSVGYTYTKAAIILVLVQYLVAAAMLGFTTSKMHHIRAGDRTLFFCASIAAPFVLVRIIYSTCAAFNPTSRNLSIRSDTDTAIAIRAILGIAMEIISVSIFIFGGIKAPKIVEAGKPGQKMPMHGTKQPQQQDFMDEARYGTASRQ